MPITVEANARFGWPFAGMANRLRRHAAEVQQLTAYRLALDQVGQSRVQVTTVTFAILASASTTCRQTGLLINDAQIAALMQHHSLTRLASHDADFDRVAGITRYGPA